jgi:hypothetical protein
MKTNEHWEVVSAYSRAQAIEDGVLVDISRSQEWIEAGFKYHGAMTQGAWEKTIAAVGHWERWPDGYHRADGSNDTLVLPAGQSVSGRLWDVLWMLKLAIDKSKQDDRVWFQVCVWRPPEPDEDCDGHHDEIRLWCLVGPGDTPDPVMTIMLEGED